MRNSNRKGITAAAVAAVSATMIPVTVGTAAAQTATPTVSETSAASTTPTAGSETPTPSAEPTTTAAPTVKIPENAGYMPLNISSKDISGKHDIKLEGVDSDTALKLSYIVDGSTIPAGWNVTPTPGGALNVTLPSNAKAGDTATIKVTLLERGNPDNRITREAKVSVRREQAENHKNWGYESDSVTVPAATTKTVKLNEAAKLPKTTKFKVTSSPAGWTAKASETTGIVTLTPDANAVAGSVTVQATFADGSTSDATFKVSSTAQRAQVFTPSYGTDLSIKPGIAYAKDFPVKFEGEGVPNVTASIPDNSETGKDFEANFGFDKNSGSFTGFYVSENAPIGSTVDIPVTFTYSDGTTNKTTFHVKVVNTTAASVSPKYIDDAGIIKSESKVFKLDSSEKIPDGTTFALSKDFIGAWDAQVDSATGAITVKADPNAKPGDSQTIKVVATFVDGSTKTIELPVTVKASQADATTPLYEDARVRPNESVTIENTGEKFPEGAKVSAVKETVTDGWNVDVTDSQALVVTPPSTAKVDDFLTFKIHVDYADGSQDGQDITVTVSVYKPDVIKRVIKRTVVVQVPPSQAEIDAAIKERDAKLMDEGLIVNNEGKVVQANTAQRMLANTGASVFGLAGLALATLIGGAVLLVVRRKKSA